MKVYKRRISSSGKISQRVSAYEDAEFEASSAIEPGHSIVVQTASGFTFIHLETLDEVRQLLSTAHKIYNSWGDK